MNPFSIYVVDDEENVREGAAMAFKRNYQVQTFETAEEALELIPSAPPDLVLLDIGLPGMDGIQALREIKRLNPEITVIMITAYEDVRSVLGAMKGGAQDYILKPFQMDALALSVANVFDGLRLRKEVQALQEQYLRENIPCFIGESAVIQNVLEFVNKVAKSPDTPVLIVGETGTGKELIAKTIHFRSPNYRAPFIAFNCAAIPKELLESELFGHERGAFTGANAAKPGLVEGARDGTLFLDEVGDMGMEAQAKMLRFIESGEYYRVGGIRKLQVRTRIISATNHNLETLISAGRFREDLYHRLAVVKVAIPSLNERPDDVIPIANYFLFEYARKFGKHFNGIAPQAQIILQHMRWRGNIRELRNLIEREVLVGDGPLLELNTQPPHAAVPAPAAPGAERSETLPCILPFSPEGVDLPAARSGLVQYYLREALEAATGNVSEAARMLNISRHALLRQMKKYGF